MKLLLTFIGIFSCTCLFSQDYLVLRKDESVIRCRIYSLNDSLISYKLWRSPDDKEYTIRRHEVLSFMFDKATTPLSNDIEKSNRPDQELLGRYHSGETVTGYIIKNNDDTIHGHLQVINVAMNQLEARFMDSTGSYTTFRPHDIKGYGYYGLEYEKKSAYRGKVTNGRRIKDGKLFLHREVSGPGRVYRFYTLFFRKSILYQYEIPPYYLGKLKKHFLVEGPGNRSYLTKGRSLKGVLLRAFDDRIMAERILTLHPKNMDLPLIVRSYNERQDLIKIQDMGPRE